jgi:hypothetical protein
MLRKPVIVSSVMQFGHIVFTDFAPSFSILLSFLALGAWLLGLHLDVGLATVEPVEWL